MVVVLTTHADMIDSLKGLTALPDNAYNGVLYASALVADKNLYNLAATYDGTGRRAGGIPQSVDALNSFKPASAHPVSKDGVTEAAVLKAYSGIVAGMPEALKALAAAAKKSGDTGEQAKALLERTEGWLKQRYDAWNAQALTIANYGEGEALVPWLEQSPTHKDLAKAVETKLDEAAGADPLKSELVARNAYRKVAPLAFSLRKPEVDQARAGLDQIVAKFGTTSFGAQAKSLRAAMDAPTK